MLHLDSFPVKMGLCIFFPSVAIAAYLIHKSIESKNEVTENDLLKSKQSLVEVKVPEDCVASIIGPHGATIKEIQRKTSTRIGFKDRFASDQQTNLPTPSRSDESSEGPKNERLLVIRGNHLNVLRAEIEIRRMIVDSTSKHTEFFYVPLEACGRIIGRKGATINDISRLSNCKIKLNDDLYDLNDSKVKQNTLGIEKSSSEGELGKAPGESKEEIEATISHKLKRVAITGSFEQIEQAKELITNKIVEERQYKDKAFNRKYRENSN